MTDFDFLLHTPAGPMGSVWLQRPSGAGADVRASERNSKRGGTRGACSVEAGIHAGAGGIEKESAGSPGQGAE